MVEIVAWGVVTAAVIVGWWVAEWLWARRRGARVPVTRDPLRALGSACRRLWRDRSLLWVLLGFWVLSAALALAHAQSPLLAPLDVRAMAERAGLPTETGLVAALEGLPDARGIPLGLGSFAVASAVLALILGWLHLVQHPWLHGSHRPLVRWPAWVAGVAFVLYLFLALYRPSAAHPQQSLSGSLLRDALPVAHAIGLPVLLAPLTVLLWHAALEALRTEGGWAPPHALRALCACWGQIAMLTFFREAPVELAASGAAAALGAQLPVMVLERVVALSMVMAPWIIVDQGLPASRAYLSGLRLCGRFAGDVLVFGLRFTLIFGVGFGALALLGETAWAQHSAAAQSALLVPRYLLMALHALTLGVLYLTLREADRRRTAGGNRAQSSGANGAEGALTDDSVD